MSLNYLEVHHAVDEIVRLGLVGAAVEEVVFLDFKIQAPFDDLNLGLKLVKGDKMYWLTFSLQRPWVGVFLTECSYLRPSKNQNWQKRFHGGYDWKALLIGHSLEAIEAIEGDRIVRMRFAKTLTLEVHLFAARPNWIFADQHLKYEWRSLAKQQEESSLKPKKALALRSFDDDENSNWLVRSFLFYENLRKESALTSLLQSISSQIEDRMSKNIRLKTGLLKQMKECSAKDKFKRYGEQIKAEMYKYAKKAELESIEVQTEQGSEVIPLDLARTLAENSEAYFQKYKKLLRTEKEIAPRAKALDEEISKLRKVSLDVLKLRKHPTETFDEALKRVQSFALEHRDYLSLKDTSPEKLKKQPNKLEKKIQKSGAKRFYSAEGLAILVGRNHKENEDLVMRVANGNDLWFHIKGRMSAHAVVQIPKNKSASLETMLDAASLVAHYSDVAPQSKVDVDYTYRKYVKRVAGSKANQAGKFLVTYTQNKTLMIKLDPKRVDRLFLTLDRK